MVCRKEGISKGRPIICGTRLHVSNVVSGIYHDGFEEYTSDHELSADDALEALRYCANADCTLDNSAKRYCYHCVLETIGEEEERGVMPGDVVFIDGKALRADKDGMLPGVDPLNAIYDPEPKFAGWLLARKILQMLNSE